MNKLSLLLVGWLLAVVASAQTDVSQSNASQTSASQTSASQTNTLQANAAQQNDQPKAQASAPASGKKMIREANINLQTTVTGNQEQPRVMYILPWQSPLSPELEMDMLSSQEDAVFGHIERDEMQRTLEAAGELDQPDE